MLSPLRRDGEGAAEHAEEQIAALQGRRRFRGESATRTMLERVRAAASKKILFLPHAVQQMARPDRMISPSEVRRVIFEGEVVEEYV